VRNTSPSGAPPERLACACGPCIIQARCVGGGAGRLISFFLLNGHAGGRGMILMNLTHLSDVIDLIHIIDFPLI
jgi:hypothetical protein